MSVRRWLIGAVLLAAGCAPAPERAEVVGGEEPVPAVPAVAEEGRVSVEGALTGEGVECPAMRADDGRLYTLAGDLGGAQAGDRVRVEGQVAQISTCMQGTTIAVERVVRLEG